MSVQMAAKAAQLNAIALPLHGEGKQLTKAFNKKYLTKKFAHFYMLTLHKLLRGLAFSAWHLQFGYLQNSIATSRMDTRA